MSDGSKGAGNQAINKAFANSQDPLKKAFLAAQDPLANCVDCSTAPTPMKTINDLASSVDQMAVNSVETKKIKLACIQASLQREVVNNGYSCDGTHKVSFSMIGKNIPCLNNSVVEFIDFALNEGINCMSTGRDPIDARLSLKNQ